MSDTRRRTVATIVATALVLAVDVSGASAATGDIDGSFGTSGQVTATSRFADIAEAPDNGFVAVDNSNGPTVSLYDARGDLVRSFGDRGRLRITTPSGVDTDQLGSIVRHGAGWIVVRTLVSGDRTTTTLVRISRGGAIDRQFGTRGSVTLPARISTVTDLAVDASNRVVVSTTEDDSPVLRRFGPDGSADTDYARNGRRVVATSGWPAALVVAADGTATLSITRTSGKRFQLARLSPAGRFVRSFGTEGIVDISATGVSAPTFVGLFRGGAGRVIVVGSGTDTNGRTVAFVSRRTDTGAIDRSYGTRGTTIIDDATWSLQQASGFLDDKGRVYVAAITFSYVVMARLDADGRPDESWGGEGILFPALPGFATGWVAQDRAVVIATYYPIGTPQGRIVRVAA